MKLLYSGGLDSYIGWHFLGKPDTIYVDIKHGYNSKERKAIQQTIPETKIVEDVLNLHLFEQADAYIPMRNAFLVLTAALHSDLNKGEEIVLVVQKGELDLGDRTPWFLHTMGTLMSAMNKSNMKVTSPFFEMTKTDMLKWYMSQGLSKYTLKKTVSCYSNSYIPCGSCGACFRRWVAFENCGLKEDYLVNPWETQLAKEYIEKMKDGKYDKDRTKETIYAFKSVGVTI